MTVPRVPQPAEALILGALGILLAISVGLLAYAVLLRGEMPIEYTDISNAVQLTASAAVAGVAAWSYYRRGPNLLLAHGAFAGLTWTLANTFWFAYFTLIGKGLDYPTIADLGFAGVFLFLIAGFHEGLPRNRLSSWAAAPIILSLLAAGLWLVAVLGPNAKTLTTFVFFALSAALLTSALLRSSGRHLVLVAATIAFVLAHLCDALDGTLPDPPWITGEAGALAAIAFSLFAIAFLNYSKEAAP